MPTQLLAPATTPATSADVTVVAGTPVNIGVYRAGTEAIEVGFRGLVFRKGPDGNYNPTQFSLTQSKPNLILVGAGVYQVRRSGTFAIATGIMTD